VACKSPNSLGSSRSSLNDNLDLLSVGVDNFSFTDERDKIINQLEKDDIQSPEGQVNILKSEVL
jgi:hypothetical protein